MKKRNLLFAGLLVPLALLSSNRTTAQTGAALAFDGSNDYVALGTVISSNASYTKEAWVYLGTGSTTAWNIVSSLNNPFWFSNGRLSAGNGNAFAVVQDPAVSPSNTWIHVAVTYDAAANRMVLYKNGAVVASSNTAPAYIPEAVFIGSHDGSLSYFQGTMDEVRIWNRALCQSEIQQYMNGSLPNPATQPGLIRYFQMNQGIAGGNNSGISQLTDASASAANGTLFNFGFATPNTTSNFVSPGAVTGAAAAWQAPEINVVGNGQSIADGTVTTGTANHTDFGAGNYSRTFTIQNTGNAPLAISGTSITGTHAAEFSVTTAPAASVDAGGSTSLTVTFTPGANTARTAVLHILNNDCNEGDYDFVLTAAPTGGALDFDGINDYATTTQLLTPSYTKEAWVKLPAAGVNTSEGNYNIVSGQLTTGGHAFWVTDGVVANSYRLAAGHNGTFDYVSEAAEFPRNTWTHVAVTYDATSSTMRLYKNGVLVNTNTNVPALTGSSNFINIGNFYDPQLLNLFIGQMDEVRVWNRALCQQEIQHNMGGRLNNPLQQTGLVLYYNFNQGSAGGNNTAISQLIDASASGTNATMIGFDRTAAASNFVYSPKGISIQPQYAAQPATGTGSSTQPIAGSTQFSNSCSALATVAPSGAAPVTGSVTTRVTVDPAVQSYVGKAYVQRHYDIEPALNPNTATGTITLYFTQAEFTAYNAVNGTDPDLPVDAADLANNKANLRITQFHGSSATAQPGSYSGWTGNGPAILVLTPSAISWNSVASRWEVSVAVTGFSGFFAAGAGLSGGVPLSVQLSAFGARKAADGRHLVEWKAGGESAALRYDIERSADGRDFTTIGHTAASGAASYQFCDAQPLAGRNYYRLKMIEGAASHYSAAALVNNLLAAGGISLWPVPAANSLTVQSSAAALGQEAVVTDMAGREMTRFVLDASQEIDVQRWPAGVYSLRTSGGAVLRIVKQ